MEIQFTIPDKYENKKALLNRMINKYRGDYNISETKDGSIYMLEFENVNLGKEFQRELDILIPDLYKY
ncbi:MAG: hypothetical protein ACOH2D_16915 [Gelidibacter sp.]|uniref:hypothetical protein n=1 Tax=Gelidibacter sp. TaxID=2018083 RepID=UPI0032674AFB